MTKDKPRDSGPRVEALDIVGADANNLKQIDVRIPLRRVTVVTGVSGSGKSSLLANTLAVEADRRLQVFLGIRQAHIEGPLPRAFIGPMPAAIHVGQRAFRASARTTIGTATGLLTTLRRLFLACAQPYSDELGRVVPPPSPNSYAGWLAKHYSGRATIWAAPVRFVATDGVRAVERLRDFEVTEVVIRSETDSPKVYERGRIVPLAKFKPLNSTVWHLIEANLGTVDLAKSKSDRKKLEGLLERAFKAGAGQVVVELHDPIGQPELKGKFGYRLDSTLHYVDPDLATIFFRPNSHLLSFNSPEHHESGACKGCQGLGRATTLDEKALIPHPERSMHDGAFALSTEKNYKYVNINHDTIEGMKGMRGFSPDVPWKKLPDEARKLILNGSEGELVTDKNRQTGRKTSSPRPFEGFRRAILDRVARGSKVSESLAFLVTEGSCQDCGGTRWSYQARALRIGGMGIHHVLAKPFVDLMTFIADGSEFARAVPSSDSALVRMLQHHSAAFVSVGLGHLTGDRGMLQISEGEGRRARLAAVLNARHAGLCLLLDEPARGLHDEDVQNMAGAITDLSQLHTVVMNEHRHALAKTAEHVIELGPGAGDSGGRVVYEGPVARSSWADAPSIERVRMPVRHDIASLTIRGATIHNIESVDCTIPLGRLTCLTGVSGSGKSSFVRGVLVPAVTQALPDGGHLEDFERRQGTWTSIKGVEHIKGLVALDQKAPPPNRRSIVATFLDLADTIRAAFGATAHARQVGLSPSDFGINAGAGRCQFCLGIGQVEEGEQWTTCPVCGGTRFGQEALSVRVEEMNIAELLDLPVANLCAQAPRLISAHLATLTAMVDLGIGHVSLGRRVDTLSGGEVQRMRIAPKLAGRGSKGLLFVLDEPAAGLHPHDVERLVRALDRILDDGKNTVILVEHNPSIIQAADWIVEFGPGSGPHGGRVVGAGSPEDIGRTDTATGRVLSGRPAPASVRPSSTHSTHPARAEEEPKDLGKQAERVKAWMKHLLGDGGALLDDLTNDSSQDRPIAALDESFWQGRRAWEIGGIDLEIGKLLLDLQVTPSSTDDIDVLAGAWAKETGSRLVIRPFLKEIQTWGLRLPASTIETATKHVQAMGLLLINADKTPLKRGGQLDSCQVRATGDLFVARKGNIAERKHLIRAALTLGGGYVELQGAHGELRRSLGPRLLDLERGIVVPMGLAPFHFSRHDRQGQCLMCKGVGFVMTLSEDLVIWDRGAAPEDDKFLHASAALVMKGVRRSDLIPFLRRMAEEGLWDRSTSYQRMDQPARDMLLFGCWTRPGHGTFLKSAKEDPSEVGSWLRWDGLYHALWGQYERSTDTRWKAAVEKSRSLRACPSCEGTGLAAQAKLLRLAGRSLHEWVRDGTAAEFHKAIKDLQTVTSRQQRTQARLLSCLEPIARQAPLQRLIAQAEGELAREVSRHVVERFTDMPVVFI